jgi:esterase/lipase
LDEQTARLLNENVWELEKQLKEGQAGQGARWALLDAQRQQIEYAEERLGIAPAHRSILRLRPDSRDGVLLVHGSTGSPEEMRGLADALFEAGCTVYAVRLPGHGQADSSLADLSWRGCLLDLHNRHRMLAAACARLHYVGFSFGAALLMQLEVNPRPVSLVLAAPAIFPQLNLAQRLLIYVGLDRWKWFRAYLGWDGEVLEAMVNARQTNWWREYPVLAAMAKDDRRLDYRGLSWLRRRFRHRGSKVQDYPTGGHQFLIGPSKSEFEASVVEFVKKIA